jgi:uncharacterized OsmC-like protein
MPDRTYAVSARSTDVFGRVLLSARDNHIVVDGPVQNGCPGEAITPAEQFLGGVAACGVELIQVIARDEGVELQGVSASIEGTIPTQRIREDVNLFASVRLHLELRGVGDPEARQLVESFKSR